MMTMADEMHSETQWRPVAYVTMQDQAARAAIVTVLERSGWAVILQPTGFHLIQAISGVIEGLHVGRRPGRIVPGWGVPGRIVPGWGVPGRIVPGWGVPGLIVPSLIVIDVRSRGCSGVTIAAGLRDLGVTIPIVLVAAPGDALPVSSDDTLRIVDAAAANTVVAELANRGRPRQLDAGRSHRVGSVCASDAVSDAGSNAVRAP